MPRSNWLVRIVIAVLLTASLATAASNARAAVPPRPRGAAPVGPAFSVDGQTGVVYAERGGTQTFHVGDLFDMPSRLPDIVYDNNPDPDFYRTIGWWTSNVFYVYATADCSGPYVSELVTGTMQPSSTTASTTFGGAVRTYSVRALQTLAIHWIEKSIDIVDSVDETTTFPLRVRSQCVTVRMTVDHVNLLANGSVGPIVVSEGTPIGLQTNQPTGPTFEQWIVETGSDCVDGSVVGAGGAGETVGATITRPPGTYSFMVMAASGTDRIYTNCVQVTVEAIPAELSVDGHPAAATYVTGQSLALYAEGFAPGASLVGVVHLGSTTCAGPAYILMTGTADATGALDTSETFYSQSDMSVRFVAVDAAKQVIKSTNCVALSHQPSEIVLRVNGSLGPVLVDGGEIHLVATGLPAGSVAHAVVGCSGSFEPDDFGQVIGGDGVFEAFLSDDLPDEFSVRVALAPPSAVSSNCVSVRLVSYLIDPVITVNGSGTPEPIELGGDIALVGEAFPPDRTATVRTFAGTTCSGDSTVQPIETDPEGNLTTDVAVPAAGDWSFVIEVDGWTSNCVPLTVTPVPVDPPAPDIGTGPITLRANGTTAPQVLPAGTAVELVTEGVGLDEPYRVSWFEAGDCTGIERPLGSGIGTTGPVGTMTRHITSTVGFRLVAGERSSNCVEVAWQAATNPGSTDPLQLVVPSGIRVPNDAGTAGAVVTWSPITTTGGVAPVTIDCTHQSGDVFPIGTTTVECTATDSADAPTLATQAVTEASFTVTVDDVEDPTIADLPDLTRTTALESVAVVFPVPAATDNSGAAPVVVCTPSPGSAFSIGTHTVTCTATDAAGNTASSTFTITVASEQPTTPGSAPTPSLPSGGGVLPATGSATSGLIMLATGLIGVGLLLQRMRRNA